MKKTIGLLAAACALAACGGSSSSGNAAVSKQFTYGQPQAVTTDPSSMSSGLSSALSVPGDVTAGSAANAGMVLFNAGDSALGDSAVGGLPTALVASPSPSTSSMLVSARSRMLATALGSADAFPSNCTQTATTGSGTTTVTFSNCSETASDGTGSISVNGTFTVSSGSISWNYTVKMSIIESSASVSATYQDSGDLDITPTAAGATTGTVKANDAAELSVNVQSQGQTITAALAQAVSLDVDYDQSCATTITGGTLEAKRVWTQKPSNASGSEFDDKGVKVNWAPGCGGAVTVQYSL